MHEQKFNQFIADGTRLRAVLDIIGVREETPKHVRYHLLSAIYQYACANKDAELEQQCDVVMESIRTES